MTKTDDQTPLGSQSTDRTGPAYSEQQRRGYDLSSLLSAKPAPTGLVIPRFLSVVAAVDEVRRGVNGPCDLDPRRVSFRGDGTAKLSTLTPPASGMTVVLGSSKYSAPEMVEETTGQIDSSLVDSYVLGFVFYEILLGKDLFEQQFKDVSGHGDFGWLTWHVDKTKRATPLSTLISGFPPVLSSLIDGMMAKEPSKRIADLKKITDRISRASEETILICNLCSLQGSDEAYQHPKTSIPQSVDAFWRRFTNTASARLRTLSWGGLLARTFSRPLRVPKTHNSVPGKE
jgi:serine/threonine protein kinase